MPTHRSQNLRRPRGAPPSVVPVLLSDGRVAWVDPDIAERYAAYSWRCRDGRGYVAIRVDGQRVYVHRLIMNAPPGRLVHHRDGNVLHNWRRNLVLCDHAQNAIGRAKRAGSSSKRFGVWRETGRKRWRAALTVRGKRYVLGRFSTELDAAQAWDRAAKKWWDPKFAKYHFD